MNNAVRALVVEDTRILGRLIASTLRELGCEIESSPRYGHALRRLETGCADLAIIDIYLPDGSGIDLVKAARKLPEPPAIIVLTADARPATIEKAKAAGADVVMTKPFRTDDLHETAQKLIDQM